jgi:hypothetical protein
LCQGIHVSFLVAKHELADLTLLPSSPFCRAASYALERRVSLTVYASDPAVPIDTNHLERALRAIPMGRRNWLSCWTEVGAEYVGKIQSLGSRIWRFTTSSMPTSSFLVTWNYELTTLPNRCDHFISVTFILSHIAIISGFE